MVFFLDRKSSNFEKKLWIKLKRTPYNVKKDIKYILQIQFLYKTQSSFSMDRIWKKRAQVLTRAYRANGTVEMPDPPVARMMGKGGTPNL